MTFSIRLLFIMFFMTAMVHADPDYEAAQKLVKETATKFVNMIKEKKKQIKKDPKVAHAMAEEVVLPHFDFERMSKRVLARNWRPATDAQKQRFVNEFKNLLLRTYTRSIVEYSDQEIAFLPYKTRSNKDQVIIQTEIKQSTGKAIPIDYTMAYNSAWKVIDVKIGDVSLVINYRSSFNRDIRRLGMEKFLDSLAAQNKAKLGG